MLVGGRLRDIGHRAVAYLIRRLGLEFFEYLGRLSLGCQSRHVWHKKNRRSGLKWWFYGVKAVLIASQMKHKYSSRDQYNNVFFCPAFELKPLVPTVSSTEIGKVVAVFSTRSLNGAENIAARNSESSGIS